MRTTAFVWPRQETVNDQFSPRQPDLNSVQLMRSFYRRFISLLALVGHKSCNILF